MSESNNVKFVENNSKWMWKRYDEQGSVIFRSPEFETERQAREDYEMNNSGVDNTVQAQPEAPIENSNVPVGEDSSVGTATPDSETEPTIE